MDTFRAVFKHCEIGGGKPLQNTDFCGAIVVVHFWLPAMSFMVLCVSLLFSWLLLQLPFVLDSTGWW